jgi:hypothetical protein
MINLMIYLNLYLVSISSEIHNSPKYLEEIIFLVLIKKKTFQGSEKSFKVS